jgi:hypothetical protein
VKKMRGREEEGRVERERGGKKRREGEVADESPQYAYHMILTAMIVTDVTRKHVVEIKKTDKTPRIFTRILTPTYVHKCIISHTNTRPRRTCFMSCTLTLLFELGTGKLEGGMRQRNVTREMRT